MSMGLEEFSNNAFVCSLIWRYIIFNYPCKWLVYDLYVALYTFTIGLHSKNLCTQCTYILYMRTIQFNEICAIKLKKKTFENGSQSTEWFIKKVLIFWKHISLTYLNIFQIVSYCWKFNSLSFCKFSLLFAELWTHH